jgi:Ca2+-binding EF-hand superfamily protein
MFNADEKKIKADEFLPIFSQIKKEKDVGTMEDFMECMKLYDKSDNGLMIYAELTHILLSLGIHF